MSMQRVRGLSFCVFWALSAVAGFYFLFAPILPLIVLNRKVYRRITDNLAAIWESYQAVSTYTRNMVVIIKHFRRLFVTHTT